MGTPATARPAARTVAPTQVGPSLAELVGEPRTDMRPGRLQVLVAVCSLLLTVGTALHIFAAFDHRVIHQGLVDSGLADAPTATAVFVGLRGLGVLFMAANALGILALWARPEWLFGTVLGVNIVQALTWVLIPNAVWSAAQDAYGWSHTVPGMMVIGTALAVAVILTATLVRRGPWGVPAARHAPGRGTLPG